MKILALDLGKFNSVCCFFDTKTRKSRFLTTPTERKHIASVLKNAKVDLVVMEACGPSGWINDLAQSLGLSTLVCSTNEEAWQWAKVKRKTDKDDALKLARLAAMRELKPVHMPSQTHREFRSLVKYRKMLDRRINKTKNTIRAWFVNHGITIDSGDKAWHTGREHIDSFRKPIQECGADELWKGELDIELTILDSLTQQLDMIVKKLEAIGKTDPRIVRLMTIPGVGPRTAEILLALIKHGATMDNQYRPPDAFTSTNESDHRGFSNHFYTQLFYQHPITEIREAQTSFTKTDAKEKTYPSVRSTETS
ncbi:IS110 family transposase [Novipirellula artificiosorum]|uniref:Transposase n=1 Tax=Novipirellula artificiosorum TaxID=2528016 RepID=A0A5C6DJ85_9BACT|nr:transposase [Novipirellula artificiosorum]TWU37443.1 Transposase [Novipirellula artificiosorum]